MTYQFGLTGDDIKTSLRSWQTVMKIDYILKFTGKAFFLLFSIGLTHESRAG